MRGLFTAGSDKLGNQANTILKTHFTFKYILLYQSIMEK
jgi:hypothetical protein